MSDTHLPRKLRHFFHPAWQQQQAMRSPISHEPPASGFALAKAAATIGRIQAVLLECLAGRPVTWLSAPPGAGKTTQVALLASGWGAPSIWWTPARDEGVAAFGRWLLSRRGRPERAGEPTVLLRKGLADLAAGTLVVIDGIDPSCPVHAELLDTVVEQLPASLRCALVSRSRLPAGLEHRVMERRLGVADPGLFRLDDAEMAQVARALGACDVAPAGLEMLDGWPGGLALVPPGREGPAGERASLERPVFRYLQAQVLEPLPDADRGFLARLAWLPRVGPAEVAQLAGDAPGSWQRLKRLAQSCLFLEEGSQAATEYRIHPALRGALREEAAARFGPAELESLQRTAAPLLQLRGEVVEAFDAYLQLGDHDGLAALLASQAGDRTAEQRSGSWLDRLEMLGDETFGRHPWLHYWRGRALALRHPVSARAHLRTAATQFGEDADESGHVMAVCALVESELLEHPELAQLRADADALGQLVAAPSSRPGALAHACLAAAWGMTDPRSPRLPGLVREACELLSRVTDPSERLRIASRLLLCTPWLSEGFALALTMEFDDQVSSASDPAAHRVAWCCVASAWHVRFGGNLAAAQVLVDTGSALALESRLHRPWRQLQYTRAELLLAQGKPHEAAEWATRLSVQADDRLDDERHRAASLKVQLLFAFGDASSALALANRVRTKMLDAHVVERGRFERLVASLCAGVGAFADADRWSTFSAESSCGRELSLSHDMKRLLAALDPVRPLDAAREAAAGVLANQRLRVLDALFPLQPAVAARAVHLAIEGGADAAYATAIIRRQHLVPPRRSCSKWPWPIAVRTFGGLSIAIGGTTLKAEGKAQQRLLELLHVLVAAGETGRTQSFLEEHFWADAESPRAALTVAVHRLRKLLGNDAAVIVHAGKVTLAADCVWTDVQALTELCQDIERVEATAGAATIQWFAEELHSLYRGAFYAGVDDPWLAAVGNKFYTRFAAAVDHLGRLLEQRDDWSSAGRLYRRVLDVETLCESAYRGLMRCAHAEGDTAAAFRFYRFCRDTLSIVLNREPSAETRNLAVRLGFVAPQAAGQAC